MLRNVLKEQDARRIFEAATLSAKLGKDIGSPWINEMAPIMSSWDSATRVLINAVEAKNSYTRGHTERVTLLSAFMAVELGLSSEECDRVCRGAILHDIGKIGIPDEILNKEAPLTRAEFEVIRLHPVIGDEILQNVPELSHVRPIVRSHHEKLDGTGYPDRLAGDEIDLGTRIVTVADIYDALRSLRPYRDPLPHAEAMRILWEEADQGKLDPKVVSSLADTLVREGASGAA